MSASLKLLIFILFQSKIDCSVKIWKKDGIDGWPSIVNPQQQQSQQCIKAVFDEEIEGSLNFDRDQQLSEIVLPKDGAIVFSSNSEIRFTDTKKCATNMVQEKKLHIPKKRLWFSTKSWITDGERDNVAKPDIYTIPCECDTVKFPKDNPIAIDLEFVDEIVANRIFINDIEDDFEKFLETTVGQKMFLNSEAVHFTVGMCKPSPKYCGCHNHNRFEKYTELLCDDESKYCREPQCLQPIQPKGHCCPMCGAILNFKIKDTCEFNMTNMSEVDRKLRRFRNGKYVDKLHYYAGMVPGKRRDDNFVQLVVAEVGDYTGISVEFMNFLTKDEHFKEDDHRIKITSGEPYIRTQSSALLIIVLTLMFVMSIYGLFYVHYVREPKYTAWVPISRLNVLRKSIAFARFENRHTDDGNDTVDVGLRYEHDEQPVEKSVNDFNNPLYEHEPVTMGNVETEMLQPSTSQIKDESNAADINLVDISLKSIED